MPLTHQPAPIAELEAEYLSTENVHFFVESLSWLAFVVINGGPKIWHIFVRFITSSTNIDECSNFFHYQNQENICNNTITNDATTPQMCRYATL